MSAVGATPALVNARRFEVSLSIGLAIHPHYADSVATLRRRADNALYEVKKTGRGRWSRAA
ncbi:hypothetical protein B6S44_06905 [Bosea sp. Tri-44]|nr:hypothetical protein B6S44_06905 [Bosea sp. Tri-44]